MYLIIIMFCPVGQDVEYISVNSWCNTMSPVSNVYLFPLVCIDPSQINGGNQTLWAMCMMYDPCRYYSQVKSDMYVYTYVTVIIFFVAATGHDDDY